MMQRGNPLIHVGFLFVSLWVTRIVTMSSCSLAGTVPPIPGWARMLNGNQRTQKEARVAGPAATPANAPALAANVAVVQDRAPRVAPPAPPVAQAAVAPGIESPVSGKRKREAAETIASVAQRLRQSKEANVKITSELLAQQKLKQDLLLRAEACERKMGSLKANRAQNDKQIVADSIFMHDIFGSPPRP